MTDETAAEKTVEAVEAVAEAVEAAADEARETADDEVERAIDAAEEALDDAQRAAQRMAEAAMQTELGNQLNELKREFFEWRDRENQTQAQITALQTEVSELKGQLAAVATISVVSPPASPSLIQQPSPETITEALEEVTEVIPDSLESVVEENPAPAPKPKRRWM